mmetsp:Transcript_47975/g.111966  ORF Transcript_47975/g.111966 Transcript_47975/m.111966 type:complete len:236 (-) Transcript_47975:185-892(-)
MGDSGEELCARKQHLAAARLCYETDDATSRQEEYLAWLSTQGVAMRNGCISQVAPGLFIGNKAAAKDVALLDKCHVIGVLSIGAGKSTGGGSVEHGHIGLKDNSRDDRLQEHFLTAVDFIEKHQDTDMLQGVLLHCQQGISRSPCMACAYLMVHYALSKEEAVAAVRSRRPVIHIAAPLLEGLAVLEAELTQERYAFAALKRLQENRGVTPLETQLIRVRREALSSTVEHLGSGH